MSNYAFNNPEPLKPYEAILITQYMYERKVVVDKWNRSDLSTIKNVDTKNSFRKLRNQLRNSMQPKDLCAIMKESRGVEIYKVNGGLHDHETEFTNAKKSLKNAIDNFNNQAQYEARLDECDMLSMIISDMCKLSKRYSDFIDKAKYEYQTGTKMRSQGDAKCVHKLVM